MRDVLWEDIFNLATSPEGSDFCEWAQVGIDVYILHCIGQASLISMVFSCHSSLISLFCLSQNCKSSESKFKFRQASNRCKRVFEATKLAYHNKTKESITSQRLGSQDFGKFSIVFSAKVNLLDLLF